MGKNQIELLKFMISYPTIHSIGKDHIKTARNLASKGLVVDYGNNQYRINMSQPYVEFINVGRLSSRGLIDT